MKIVKTVQEVKETVNEWRKQGLTIGLVPTMGFLHEGHQSLINASVKNNDKTVVSIFVNPIQFGKNEDLEAYPRDMNRDSALCENAGVDLIFNPEPEEMYPDGFFTYTDVETLTHGLCGASRPGHFRGVCTVVSKLFHIVNPDRAYFGQKDAQQLAVIKKMVRDLNFDLEVIGCPTVRESDGLAKSSRNTYLNEEERRQAVIISQALKMASESLEAGETEPYILRNKMIDMIESMSLAKIDYIEFVDWDILQPVKELKKPLLVATAVKFGKTRLIDNYIWE